MKTIKNLADVDAAIVFANGDLKGTIPELFENERNEQRDGSCSDVLAGDASKQVDHHLELAAPRPRAFGFFA
jgi:hypothetical protein